MVAVMMDRSEKSVRASYLQHLGIQVIDLDGVIGNMDELFTTIKDSNGKSISSC
jgi:hypothetical protein